MELNDRENNTWIKFSISSLISIHCIMCWGRQMCYFCTCLFERMVSNLISTKRRVFCFHFHLYLVTVERQKIFLSCRNKAYISSPLNRNTNLVSNRLLPTTGRRKFMCVARGGKLIA